MAELEAQLVEAGATVLFWRYRVRQATVEGLCIDFGVVDCPSSPTTSTCPDSLGAIEPHSAGKTGRQKSFIV